MKRKKTFVGMQLESVKDMAKDIVPKLFTLLDPQILQNPQTLQAGLVAVATGFLGDRFRKFLEDISNRKDNIDKTVLESEKSKQVLIGLAKFAAQKNPDLEVWEAAKKIFIQTLQKNMEEQHRMSLYELISICEELRGTEVRILAGSYEIYQEVQKNGQGANTNITQWASVVSRKIGLEIPEEVLRYEDNLVKQKLICPAGSLRGDVQHNWWGSSDSSGSRLTLLGRRLAESLLK